MENFTNTNTAHERDIIKKCIELAELAIGSKVDKGHGIDHALKVLFHSNRMIEELKIDQPLNIQLASLLHDVDDRKFFPQNVNYENARKVLSDLHLSEESKTNILEMIKLVSFSSNTNSFVFDYRFIPRLADRLEATGKIGIRRCFEYTIHTNRPILVQSTPLGPNPLFFATQNRLNSYLSSKTSKSFIDHFYDKVLHIGKSKTFVKYFDVKVEKKQKNVINFLRMVYLKCDRDPQKIKSMVDNL